MDCSKLKSSYKNRILFDNSELVMTNWVFGSSLQSHIYSHGNPILHAFCNCILHAYMVFHVLGHGQCSFDSFFIRVKSEPSIFPLKQKIQKNKYNIIKCFFKTRKPTSIWIWSTWKQIIILRYIIFTLSEMRIKIRKINQFRTVLAQTDRNTIEHHTTTVIN